MTGSVSVDVSEALTLREHQPGSDGARGMFRIGINSTLSPANAARPADVGVFALTQGIALPLSHTDARCCSLPDAVLNSTKIHINSIRKLAMHGEQTGAKRYPP